MMKCFKFNSFTLNNYYKGCIRIQNGIYKFDILSAVIELY